MGIRVFLLDMERGISLWALEILSKIREDSTYPGIKIIGLLSKKNHITNWSFTEKSTYTKLTKLLDETYYVYNLKGYTQDSSYALTLAQEFMLDIAGIGIYIDVLDDDSIYKILIKYQRERSPSRYIEKIEIPDEHRKE